MVSGHHVIFRVVANLREEGDCEKALESLSEEAEDRFAVSWFPFENVLEVIIKRNIPEPGRSEEETIDRETTRLREIFSIEDVATGFIERYRLDHTIQIHPHKQGTTNTAR